MDTIADIENPEPVMVKRTVDESEGVRLGGHRADRVLNMQDMQEILSFPLGKGLPPLKDEPAPLDKQDITIAYIQLLTKINKLEKHLEELRQEAKKLGELLYPERTRRMIRIKEQE